MVCNSFGQKEFGVILFSLNPYSTGIWSATVNKKELYEAITNVLILILLEYGLQRVRRTTDTHGLTCLNPYSTGIWSATHFDARERSESKVLILILLEYGLQPLKSQTIDLQTLKT